MAAIDDVVLGYMRSALGFDFVDLGPSVQYVGSPTTPVVGDLSHFAESGYATNPEHWVVLSEGLPLDPETDFVAPTSWRGLTPTITAGIIDLRESTDEIAPTAKAPTVPVSR